MMSVYVDVLLVLNLYINYFLIRSTALFLHRSVTAQRCLLSAGIGALCSLVILLPELNFALSALIKLAVGTGMVFAAFGRQKKSDFAISALCFLIINFVFAGLMLALWIFFAPFGMFYRNGTAYFNIPIIAVALFTIAAYAAIKLIRCIADRKTSAAHLAVVEIEYGNKTVTLNGLADTGNSLCDLFSGKPVIICSADALNNLLPENILLYLAGSTDITGIRLVPCGTVTADALLPLFTPVKVTISGKPCDAVIGVTKNSFEDNIECIFSPKLISL